MTRQPDFVIAMSCVIWRLSVPKHVLKGSICCDLSVRGPDALVLAGFEASLLQSIRVPRDSIPSSERLRALPLRRPISSWKPLHGTPDSHSGGIGQSTRHLGLLSAQHAGRGRKEAWKLDRLATGRRPRQATEIQGATLDDQRILIGCIGGGNNVGLFVPLPKWFWTRDHSISPMTLLLIEPATKLVCFHLEGLMKNLGGDPIGNSLHRSRKPRKMAPWYPFSISIILA
ncbi:uncharacterized protein TRIREDRAFT_107346 [Trichoderma reesei QM6a]|uniref:Predicted protein n=1 Tax=Hypocrea jecorina (strain QM6a) TaxID=431241 RepID=G0RJE8_HYPJQ|nr:uncharacterized protein TRIREDRAFT_107346 [Trichoderma reesei QM6a]EGR48577.1 predicted protein [Trichoderma reesei QM6a]